MSASETTTTKKNYATLRVEGPDSKGIVAAFAQLLYGHGCNIVDAEQHTDGNRFFQRIVLDYGTLHTDRISLTSGIDEVCERFKMTKDIDWGESPKKMCIVQGGYLIKQTCLNVISMFVVLQ